MKSGGVGGVPRATSYSRELAGAGKARVAWRAGRTAAGCLPKATQEQQKASQRRARGQSPVAGPECTRLDPGGASGHRSAAFFAFCAPPPRNPQAHSSRSIPVRDLPPPLISF